jgi:hypothetical protein
VRQVVSEVFKANDAMYHTSRRYWLFGILMIGLSVAFLGVLRPYTTRALTDNRQPWTHISGTCDPSVAGAVLSRSTDGCGGSAEFDATQVYGSWVIQDTASSEAPCPGIATGAMCYRMWFVGIDAGQVRRIGYAVSPDGRTWSRVPGAAEGGSVLGPGPADRFDSNGVTIGSVIKDGGILKMWYTGIGSSGLVEGIGHATSTDGQTWTRIQGPLSGQAVLRASGSSGRFDRDQALSPAVLKDQASALMPCENARTSGDCYRMWYEGLIDSGGPTYRIGYAVSPDGLNWTRVLGSSPSKAVLDRGPAGSFDENGVGVASVIKDGALYRMWYDAKDYSTPDRYTLGHVVSTDGVNWVRPVPNQPVYQGSDDPGVFSPDNVWAPRALKDGSVYRMWYAFSTTPQSQRIGYATMTPGAALGELGIVRTGGTYTIAFATRASIPAGGSVLLTPAPELPIAQVIAGGVSGFAAGATLSVEPAAVSDGPARGVARGALLVRLPAGAPAGAKTISFGLGASPSASTRLLIQIFDAREVLEYGVVDLFDVPEGTPTQTAVPAPNRWFVRLPLVNR